MGQDAGAGGAPVSGIQDPEEIKREIEQTREELGDTVEVLAAKTDVKAQATKRVDAAKASAADAKERLVATAREASPDSATAAAAQVSQKARENPFPLAAAAALGAGFLIGRLTKR